MLTSVYEEGMVLILYIDFDMGHVTCKNEQNLLV